MNKDDLKVVPFNKNVEEEEPSYLLVTYKDGSSEKINSDSFGMSLDITNFLVFWRQEPYELVSFIDSGVVKKVEIIVGKFEE